MDEQVRQNHTAWVICDNIWKWEAKGEPQTNQNIQISFLEKIDGEWKFSFNAFVAAPEPETEDEDEDDDD